MTMDEPFDSHAMKDVWIQLAPESWGNYSYQATLFHGYTCLVCHQDLERVKGATVERTCSDHCCSAHHKKKIASLREMQDQVKTTLQILHETHSLSRVPRLHSEQWQDKVFGMFFRGMFYKNHNITSERVERVLSHYNLVDSLSLLELAVWKAICLENAPESGYVQMMAWHRGGWKTLKEQKRRCNAIYIVLHGVLPYLSE